MKHIKTPSKEGLARNKRQNIRPCKAVRSVWWCGSERKEVGLSLLLPDL